MAVNVRELVLDTLLALERGEQYSNQIIRDVLDKYDYLETRDKAFFKRVTEGTIERQIELDYYLNCFSTVPASKMKPLVRCLLRMSVYQLLYMDSVPDSAVCNEACKLAAKRKFTNLRGFVNGVLRTISGKKEDLPLPDGNKDNNAYLSVRYSMPVWLVELFLKECGEEMAEHTLQGLLSIHPVSLRFDSRLTEDEREKLAEQIRERGCTIEKGSYLPYSYRLEQSESISALPGFSEGKWTVQDVSSSLAVEAAGIKPGDFVLDVCAAPGGKSLLAAEKAGSLGRVLARDVSEEKVNLIRENGRRMGADNLEIEVWDATVPDSDMEGKADVLLLDVPCSGLGILGKKRDIKYHISPDSLSGLEQLQKDIVKSCVGYVRPGGTVVYSTCTIHESENEAMVKYITEELGLQPVSLEERLPKRLLKERQKCLNLQKQGGSQSRVPLTEEEQAACIQLLPYYMEADGFFIAVFRRK